LFTKFPFLIVGARLSLVVSLPLRAWLIKKTASSIKQARPNQCQVGSGRYYSRRKKQGASQGALFRLESDFQPVLQNESTQIVSA
jgi:hypothetical protein